MPKTNSFIRSSSIPGEVSIHQDACKVEHHSKLIHVISLHKEIMIKSNHKSTNNKFVKLEVGKVREQKRLGSLSNSESDNVPHENNR